MRTAGISQRLTLDLRDTRQLAAVALSDRLRAAGHTVLLAGGCVRDLLLGRTPKDYDVATSATPDQVLALFPGANAVGKSFGVVIVADGGVACEVATFRRDLAYVDGRRPEGVVFSDPPTDAQRRDFTVNALFLDPVSGEVLDYVGGLADLSAGIVRAVGDPAQRFAEDHLRLLRAARFAATLGFEIEPATAAAIRATAPQLARISIERVREELSRTLLEAQNPGAALELLDDLGLLGVILPEVVALKNVEQPPQFHPEGDVFRHTVMMLTALPERELNLALAVLLHDVGKPPTAEYRDGRWRFEKHASVGEEMVKAILGRLRYPRETIETVSFMVGNHMRFGDVRGMRRATLRRLVGAPSFAQELELHRLDCQA
ncbi:MAG: CCA tRNA nucleotidyltransferase, partial [bacterium]